MSAKDLTKRGEITAVGLSGKGFAKSLIEINVALRILAWKESLISKEKEQFYSKFISTYIEKLAVEFPVLSKNSNFEEWAEDKAYKALPEAYAQFQPILEAMYFSIIEKLRFKGLNIAATMIESNVHFYLNDATDYANKLRSQEVADRDWNWKLQLYPSEWQAIGEKGNKHLKSYTKGVQVDTSTAGWSGRNLVARTKRMYRAGYNLFNKMLFRHEVSLPALFSTNGYATNLEIEPRTGEVVPLGMRRNPVNNKLVWMFNITHPETSEVATDGYAWVHKQYIAKERLELINENNVSGDYIEMSDTREDSWISRWKRINRERWNLNPFRDYNNNHIPLLL